MKGRRKKSLKSSGRIANNESGVRTRYLLKGSKWRDHYINQSGSNILMLCYVMLCYVMLCYVMLCYVMLCSFSCVMPRRLNFRVDVSERQFHLSLDLLRWNRVYRSIGTENSDARERPNIYNKAKV